MHALTALNKVIPGFEKAKLRNFNMRIGIRDTRKIIGKYNLTENDVKNQARFDDSIGIFPEFIDGYAILILPTTGRYFEVRGQKHNNGNQAFLYGFNSAITYT